MSNAAVINATATLGRVVGSPITIVTDGTVTPKAYGKGAGAWSATLAFAPVVNGVTGSPLTLTISNNQPANVAQSILTDATSWVGWVVSSVGEFEATGIVEGVTGSDSLSGFLGIYKDDASAPKYAIETGSTAMVAGVEKQWNGSYWIAPAALGGGIVYDGTTYPLPLTAPYKGYKIAVVNPAVPDGWSTLKWTGTGWAPHKRELIAAVWRGAAPVALVTPGVIGQVEIFGATGNLSKIIPGYMIPAGLLMKIQGGISIRNAAGGAPNAQVRLGVSAIALTQSQAPLWRNITPAAGFVGIGQSWTDHPTVIDCAYVTRRIEESTFASPVNTGSFPGNTCGTFFENAARLLAYATTTSVTDQIQFDGCELISEGNL